ncbi:uncharacterized protein [Gossypium hirsutum]|uniref:Uncharacterized protein isoform X1 n=1 Tax=Gossypium hirsutum TaxID=3635 RepID=A0ABM2YTQ6_GOSHI|nr:uncharacterized protein LOC107896367 isoform X1 [Gossypium hirsutum]
MDGRRRLRFRCRFARINYFVVHFTDSNNLNGYFSSGSYCVVSRVIDPNLICLLRWFFVAAVQHRSPLRFPHYRYIKIEAVGDRISMSIASEVVVQQKSEEKIEEKASNLYSALWSIEGLTDDQRYDALSKIPIIQLK